METRPQSSLRGRLRPRQPKNIKSPLLLHAKHTQNLKTLCHKKVSAFKGLDCHGLSRPRKDGNVHIAIVGAGINGLTIAYILANSGFKITLIEKSDIKKKVSQEDGRAISISGGSKELLEQRNIWELLPKQIGKIERILVQDNKSPVAMDFDSSSVSQTLGYIVKSDFIINALYEKVSVHKNITLRDGFACTEVKFTDKEACVISDTGDVVKSTIIIAVDGYTSKIRDLMALKNRQVDYQQIAYTFDVHHTKSHNNTAYEFFYPNGPFAFLPLFSKHESSVVWTEKRVAQNIEVTKSEMEGFLQPRAIATHGNTKIIGTIKKFPLSMSYMTTYFKDRVVFIGDALHFIHPLAGQGYNLSLRDIDLLAKLLIQYSDAGLDIGSKILFEEFQRRRKIDNLSMIAFTDGINKIFSSDNTWMKLARNIGLEGINSISYVKKFFIKRAMGKQ